MIEVEKAQGFPVSLACELLSVSRSGFWQWERRPPSQRELSDAWLTEKIKQIHTENRGVYGARRIHAELRMTHDVRVGKKRVARLMRQAGISGLMPKKRGRTTIRVPGVPVADDLVKRQFKPDSPNVLWFTDITYLRTWEG
jgi:putative transposase